MNKIDNKTYQLLKHILQQEDNRKAEEEQTKRLKEDLDKFEEVTSRCNVVLLWLINHLEQHGKLDWRERDLLERCKIELTERSWLKKDSDEN